MNVIVLLLAGDNDLDPDDLWPGGPPDGAAARIDSTQSYSRYFLFKGNVLIQPRFKMKKYQM